MNYEIFLKDIDRSLRKYSLRIIRLAYIIEMSAERMAYHTEERYG